MSDSDSTTKHRYVVLDGMRGLAALAVITDHVPSPLMMNLLPGRYLAVDFFFVLSGFVLAYAYGAALGSGLTPVRFMRLRLIRLYPLYLAGTLIGAAFFALSALKGWGEATLMSVATSLAAALTFLPTPPALSIWPDAPYPLDGPAWSLFFELFVNAVLALVALRGITRGVCIAIMAVAGLWLVPTAFAFGQLDGGFAWSNFIAGFPRVLYGFFAGVLLYLMHERARAPALPAWACYLALFAIFAVPAAGQWRAAYDLVVVLILFPGLVWLSAGAQVQGAALKLSAFVGAMSYGVYILHVPLWHWLELGLQRAGLDAALPGVAKVALAGVAALAAAAILQRVYDAPLRRFLSGRGARSSTALTRKPAKT